MLRAALVASLAMAAAGPCFAADQIIGLQVRRHAHVVLPPVLPRAHYNYRTSIVYQPARAAVVVAPDSDVLISFPSTPLLPGSFTLPGYYGRPFDYDYQGPYYGGPYPSYFWRLPYACGIYGYC
jgi:hypothetical protein